MEKIYYTEISTQPICPCGCDLYDVTASTTASTDLDKPFNEVHVHGPNAAQARKNLLDLIGKFGTKEIILVP